MKVEQFLNKEIKWVRKAVAEAQARKDITDEKWCTGYLDALLRVDDCIKGEVNEPKPSIGS